MEPDGYFHTGKILLDENEYKSFKTMLASGDVSNINLEIINHDYPILIEYYYNSVNDIKYCDIEKVSENRNCAYTLWILTAIIPMCVAICANEEIQKDSLRT
jgi:hypothetical protein